MDIHISQENYMFPLNLLVWSFCSNRFIKQCGSLLTHLRLSACEFVNKNIIDTIANTCSDLIGMLSLLLFYLTDLFCILLLENGCKDNLYSPITGK